MNYWDAWLAQSVEPVTLVRAVSSSPTYRAYLKKREKGIMNYKHPSRDPKNQRKYTENLDIYSVYDSI